MWKTPYKSVSTTAAVSQPVTTARSNETIVQYPINFPSIIFENPQYIKLYDKIYRTQEKSYLIFSQQEAKSQVKTVKETISEKLLQESKRKSFHKKFDKLISTSRSRRKVIKHTEHDAIGLTKQQQNTQLLQSFLLDHKKAVELQQQARLIQYYLRDQEKTKSKIDYINRVELTDKHRRTDPLLKDRQAKLFKLNNQMTYHLHRKTAYVSNDKLMSKSLKNAKNNPTYLRMKNFSQIQYILNEDNQNLMITREIPKSSSSQIIFNEQRKIFLSLSFASDSIRSYYDYIRQKDFQKLKELLLPQTQTEQIITKINDGYLDSVIKKIIQYKQNKVLHFEDFLEILTRLKEQKNYDFLLKLKQRCKKQAALQKKFYRSQLDEQIDQSKGIIEGLVKSSKFQVITKKIYEMYNQKIIGRYYLPQRDITQLMKNLNIVPKYITMPKFMFICYWLSKRREGFTSDEFIDLQVAVGLQIEGNISKLDSYFGLFDMKKIAQN